LYFCNVNFVFSLDPLKIYLFAQLFLIYSTKVHISFNLNAVQLLYYIFSFQIMTSFNSEYFSRSTTFFVWKILLLDQIFLQPSESQKNTKLGTKKNICPSIFCTHAPSNFIVIKYSKCSRAGF
jgi:hypothetical protein